MTDYLWPDDLVPYEQSFYLQPYSGGSESPFNRVSKIYGLAAPRWISSMALRAPDSADRWGGDKKEWGERIDAFLDLLQGRQNRVLLWDFRRPGRAPGSWSNAAIAAGDTIVTLNLAVPGDVRPGEYIGGDGRPHRITSVQAVGSDLVVTVQPPFAAAVPAGGAGFQQVAGAFRLTSDDAPDNRSAVGELTQYALQFVEDPAGPLDSYRPSVINVSDGATPAYTLTQVPGGVSISNTSGNKDLLFSTGIGPGRKRVILTMTPTSGVGNMNYIGIGFRDPAGNWLGLGWQDFGPDWIVSRSNGYSGAPGSPLVQDTPAMIVGDVLRFQADIDGAGNVYLTVSKNGGSRWNVGVKAPVGDVYLFLNYGGPAAVTFALQQQPVAVPAPPPSLFGAVPVGVLRAAPAGFVAPRLPSEFKVYKQAGVRLFSTNLDLKPPLSEADHTAFVQYVSPSGNDANPGIAAAPVKSIYTALGRCQGTEGRAIIKAEGGLYDYASGWANGNALAKVLQVVSSDGNPVLSSMHDSGLTWSLQSGATYQATFAESVTGVFDAAHLTADGDYSVLALAADLAGCNSTAGSFFISGTTIYVHASDGRVPDANLRVYKRPTAIGPFPNGHYSIAGGLCYLQDIAFEGGVLPFLANLSGVSDQATVLGKRCTFKYGGGYTLDGTGPVTGGDFLGIWQECVSALNSGDGFSHGTNGFGSIAGAGIELDCIGRWNGRNPASLSNNNSSSHGATVVRIKTQAGWGDYHHSENRGIADTFDVADALSWHLGITSRDSRSGYANFTIGSGASSEKMWLDTVTSSGVAVGDLEAAAGATLYHFDLVRGGTDAGGGTITTYTP